MSWKRKMLLNNEQIDFDIVVYYGVTLTKEKYRAILKLRRVDQLLELLRITPRNTFVLEELERANPELGRVMRAAAEII